MSSPPTLRDVKLARAKDKELRGKRDRANARIVEVQDELAELGKKIGQLRVAELIDPSTISEMPVVTAASQALATERLELQQTVADVSRTLDELGNEADRRATSFRTHTRKVLAEEMGRSIGAQKELLAESLAYLALHDDVAKGVPSTSRTPGSLAGDHVSHTDHQNRVEALRQSLMQQHGFAEMKAEAAE